LRFPADFFFDHMTFYSADIDIVPHAPHSERAHFAIAGDMPGRSAAIASRAGGSGAEFPVSGCYERARAQRGFASALLIICTRLIVALLARLAISYAAMSQGAYFLAFR
jgi:hypothetical protein